MYPVMVTAPGNFHRRERRQAKDDRKRRSQIKENTFWVLELGAHPMLQT
jgi:hypothetical protein